MAKQYIDNTYLKDFFGIGEGPEAEAELDEIQKQLVRLQFANGEDICTIDGEPDGMFFLESGSAVVLDRDGAQINLMRAGQYFGEYAVLSQQRRLSTVRSLGRTIVYKLGNEEVLQILQRHPDAYGELMKRVYSQVSRKHAQLTALSRMRRGILQAPGNKAPMSFPQMLLHYGIVAVIFLLCFFLVPKQSAAPVFLIPLGLMLGYVLLTKRTIGSLVVAGLLAALLVKRSGLCTGYTDALLETLSAPDNAFTVMVMALMGSVVTLIEASGAVTAFRKVADQKIRSQKQTFLSTIGILILTGIDDCLNMVCAATSLRSVSDEQRIPREHTSLMLSMLPTVVCSFLPFSLWGIFVISNIGAAAPGEGFSLFVKAIPFDFFPIIVILGMLLFSLDRLPKIKALRTAEKRVEDGGELWPEGSERYLPQEDGEVWGKIRNLLVPVFVLAVTSLTFRSFWSKSIMLDSAVGLVATLLVMFFLYCSQGIMSPETFLDHLITGIQSMVLPIVLYLLSMCFSSLLEEQAMGSFFDMAVIRLTPVAALLPAMLFFLFTLLTMALGSSWAMYVIGFPIAVRAAMTMGLNLPLCVGAICAAGIAGEKLCPFTSDSMTIGNAIGCKPETALAVRIPYSVACFLLSLVFYIIGGLF